MFTTHKKLALAIMLVSMSQLSLAQKSEVKIKDIPADGSGKAVIIKDVDQIKEEAIREHNAQKDKDSVKKDILSGDDEIVGEENYNPALARDAWKKACADWKKEFKAENKDSKILRLDCGRPEQHRTEDGSGQYYFTSTARYKIKALTTN